MRSPWPGACPHTICYLVHDWIKTSGEMFRKLYSNLTAKLRLNPKIYAGILCLIFPVIYFNCILQIQSTMKWKNFLSWLVLTAFEEPICVIPSRFNQDV